MDFLDSIEMPSTKKKSHRVQSWYLYEQYKSLERHQARAAKKLKDKSFQDRLLHRELRERRARRSICAQGTASNPTFRHISRHASKSCVTSSDNSFFESFCEVQQETAGDAETDGTSHDAGSSIQRSIKSTSSVLEKENSEDRVTYNTNFSDDIKEELELVKKSIAENISIQLETVKDNFYCSEDYTSLEEESVSSSRDLTKYNEYTDDSNSGASLIEDNSNVYALWTKLVSFAYQVVQLSHGNCYFDFSTQLLTAVLACDVLRRGVNKMCNILQPYVSPIKLATDTNSTCSIKIQKHVKRKLSSKMKKSMKSAVTKSKMKHSCNKSRGVRKAKLKSHSATYSDERKCDLQSWHLRPLELSDVCEKNCIASEPWQCLRSGSSPTTIWPEELDSNGSKYHLCSCTPKIANPMLKLASYFDTMLNDIGDSSL